MAWKTMGHNLLMGLGCYDRWYYDVIKIFVHQKEGEVELIEGKKACLSLCRKKTELCRKKTEFYNL